MIELVS